MVAVLTYITGVLVFPGVTRSMPGSAPSASELCSPNVSVFFTGNN